MGSGCGVVDRLLGCARGRWRSVNPSQRNYGLRSSRETVSLANTAGGKPPDVLLVCDDITRVANGGLTHIMNLVTACVACNAGKGATLLSDQSVLGKRRCQLEELNERRTQIEMLLQWRDDLLSIEWECDGRLDDP